MSMLLRGGAGARSGMSRYGGTAVIVASLLAAVAYVGAPGSTADGEESAPPSAVAVQESAKPVVLVAPPVAPVAATTVNKLDELGRHASFSNAWLAGHGFFPESAALDGLHRLLDARVDPRRDEKSVALAFGPAAGAVPDAGTGLTALAQQERFIRAPLPFTTAAAGDSVIVRWRSLSDEAVLELSVQPLSTDAAASPEVWMHRTADWPVGHYRIEVLSSTPDLRLLASGEFEIVPDGTPVTPFMVVTSTLSRP